MSDKTKSFKALYQSKYDETVYVVLTNLAKLNLAIYALDEMLIADDEPVIDEAQFEVLKKQLHIWRNKLYAVLTSEDA
jgi:hypothetical protein